MPITAETFELDHFHALHRGLDAAEGALRLRDEEIEKVVGERDSQKLELDERISELEAAITVLESRPWDALVESVVDVDRGIRDLPELIGELKDAGWIDPR